MDFCIQVPIQPLFLCQPRVSVLLCCEFVDLSIQLVFDLFLSWIPVIRHHTSLMKILVPATEPFVGFVGPDLGLKEVVSSQTLMGASREGITQEGRLHRRSYAQGYGGQPSIMIEKLTARHETCVKGLASHRGEISCL